VTPWERRTAEQLWSQFRRETRASVTVFSAETGRDVPEEWARHQGRGAVVSAVARAMFYRLSPARRIILLLAVVLLVIPQVERPAEGSLRILFPNAGLAAFLLLVLPVLELADRVSLKRDLEIAREMRRMLLPQSAPAPAVAGDGGDGAVEPSDLGTERRRAALHHVPGGGTGRGGPRVDVGERGAQSTAGGAGGTVERLAQGGLPLGMFPGARYESGRGELRAGDRLLIYTDGVTEASDPADVEFGDARLENLAVAFGDATAAECMRRLFTTVDGFAGTAPQSDDITCLVLRVAAAQKASQA
jgi:hypothetical protein